MSISIELLFQIFNAILYISIPIIIFIIIKNIINRYKNNLTLMEDKLSKLETQIEYLQDKK